MLKRYLAGICALVMFLAVTCKKEEVTPEVDNEELVTAVTQYVYKQFYTGTYVYVNESDIGKKDSEIKDKKWLKIAQKVTVKSKKKIGGESYYLIQLADTTEYWIKADMLVEKFITINQADVSCYNLPDDDEIPTHRLQPGDFGAFMEVSRTNPDFMKVQFLAFRGLNPDDEPKWVGEKWIKGGYTDNLNAARQSYFLALAYNQLYARKPNKEKAIKFLEDAIDATAGAETSVTSIITSLKSELTAEEVTTEEISE
jgi:hypothetical protein